MQLNAVRSDLRSIKVLHAGRYMNFGTAEDVAKPLGDNDSDRIDAAGAAIETRKIFHYYTSAVGGLRSSEKKDTLTCLNTAS